MVLGHPYGKSFASQIEDGTANAEGDKEILSKLAATLAIFTPDFEMVPGTKEQAPRQDLNPYEIGPLEMQHE
jgi:sRNA-binding protein